MDGKWIHAYTEGNLKKSSYADVAKLVSVAWNAVEPSTIISGFTQAGIIPSSQGADTDLELSDSEENSLELNEEMWELFQSNSKSSDFEGF